MKRIHKILFALLFSITFFACDDSDGPSKTDKKDDEVKKAMAIRSEVSFVQNFIYGSLADVTASSSAGRKVTKQNVAARAKAFSACAETINETEDADTLLIKMDFGEGCENEDGTVLAGKVDLIMYFVENGFFYHAKFENYREIYEDGEESPTVNGESGGSLKVDLFNSNLQLNQVDRQQLNLTYEDGSKATFASLIEAESTAEEIRIFEYSAEGLLSNGDTFSISVVEPLVYNLSCSNVEYPVKGIEAYTFNDHSTEINYGDGECDNDYQEIEK